MVGYRGFRLVFKIERPSGHDLISSDESKRRNDSKPGRIDSFAANGVDIVDCDIEIDFRNIGVVRVESGLRGCEWPRVQELHGRS